MAIEAVVAHGPGEVKAITSAALVSGQVVQLPDGRAGYYAGLNAAAAGDYVTLKTEGVVTVPKVASKVMLAGQEAWWAIATNVASLRILGQFYAGLVIADAAAAGTTVKIDLNVKPSYAIQYGDGSWVTEATLGLGVVEIPGGTAKLEFDAVAEVAQAALVSDRTVDVDDGPIFEAEVGIFDIGNNAALDIDLGLASASHASDFEAIAAFAAIHFDSPGLSILVHSDDAATDVAPADSLIDAVDDTYFFVQIDCRNKADVQIYVNGVDAVPSGTTLVLTAYTSTLKAIALIEKTSDDTVADVRVRRMTVRTRAAG